MPSIPFATQRANVRSHPNNPSARLTLAEAYAQSGETFGAIQQLQIALKLGDNSEATALRLADLDTETGQTEDAVSVLTAAATRPHPSKPLLMALAHTRLDLGDFQGAADAIAPLATRTTELSSQEQQLLARTLLLAGDAEQAAKWIPASSQDPEWLALAGLKEMLLGHAQQAETWLSRSVAQNPTDGWNAYLLGRAALLAGHTAQAQIAWNAAVRSQGAPPQAFIGLARLLLSAGHVHEADSLLSGVASDGRFDPAYWQAEAELAHARHLPGVEQIARGYAAFNAGDPWKAEATWIAALPGASDADARALYEAIINSSFRRQDSDISLRYAKAATTRWPNDPLFLRKYGEILLGNNQLPRALAVATQLRQVTPPDKEAEANDLLGRVALDSGRGDLVTQFTERYRALAPTNPTPLLQLAEWQYKAGHSQENLERTLKLYQEAATLAPQNAEAQAHVGILLFDLKRTEEATQALLHALTLSPRVLDGTPDVLLSQLYQQQGLALEANVHSERYRHLRTMKEVWPPLMKAMRQERPERDWLVLGAAALEGHEDWIALCAFHQATQRAPQDPVAWRSLAEAQKRFGQFEQALAAMRKAHLLTP